MELRDFAERVLFASTIEEKLARPEVIEDSRPGPPLAAPDAPGRPPELRFKPQGSGPSDFPGLRRLEQERERGRLLHFLANHELLATELMALVLLRFPEAPTAFRRGVLQTLKDEQLHARLYLQHLSACGIRFGEIPVSGYFWRCVSAMANPMDYVVRLCLTFEQANLDFCRSFARGFERVGDNETARLLERIYRDEISHVACGLKWFRRWKNPQESDWEAFCGRLKFPLSPQRAKGPELDLEGRRAAGLDPAFIAQLSVYSQSKGRTPTVFWFNPFAEGRIAHGKSFTPKKHQLAMAGDLANVPQFLCRQDDVVLVAERPSVEFLSRIKEAGFPLPEFVELEHQSIPPASSLRQRKIGGLRPWAWGPDSVELLTPLLDNLSRDPRPVSQWFNEGIAELYSKASSAALLKKVLARWGGEPWICAECEVGIAVSSVEDALEAVAAIRRRGHHRVVAKEAHGLAGHNAIRLWEPEISAAQRRWINSAVGNGRQLVIEPWLERLVDFSVQFEMGPRALKLCGFTGLVNDLKGQYQANGAAANFARHIPAQVSAMFREPAGCAPRLERLYDDIRVLLEAELARSGYVGPVGIDAFVYRPAPGECRLKPIVEINPRYTMGRLLLELMRQTAPGSSGLLRLVNRTRAQAEGFADLAAYAGALSQRFPLCLEGVPIRKFRSGALCLNDPARAQTCLAIFRVGRTPDELLAGTEMRPPAPQA